MGIPDFFRHFILKIGKYYECNDIIVYELPKYVHTLSIDMGGILHNCAQKCYSYADQANPERSLYVSSTSPEILEKEYFTIVTDKLLSLVSEVRPSEVFIIAVDGTCPLAKIKQQRSRRYQAAQSKDPLRKFDSNCLTTGTEFMARLDMHITKWLKDNSSFMPPMVIYSSHLVPGEGEHKIMDIYRERKDFQKPEKYHVLYGKDADLIILSSLAPISNIYLYREDDAETLNIQSLKNCLKYKFMGGRPSALQDFSIIMCFIGNDFLPRMIPMLDVRYSLFEVLKVYKSLRKPLVKRVGHNKYRVDFKNFSEFLKLLGDFEASLITGLSYKKDYYPLSLWKTCLVQSKTDNKILMDKFRVEWYNLILSPPPNADTEVFQHLLNTKTTFGLTEDSFNDMLYQYLLGVEWVLRYYTEGPMNVTQGWYYPYNHAPLFKELSEMADTIEDNEAEEELNSLNALKFDIPHQLLSVLPPQSKELLPKLLLQFIDDEFSPIKYMFPKGFLMDYEGSSRGHPIIPFVDPKVIIDTVNTIKWNPSQYSYYFKSSKNMVLLRTPIENVVNPITFNEKRKSPIKLASAPVGSPEHVWKKVYK